MRDTVVDTRIIKQALKLACRAPSLHNSQPWRWVVDGGTVMLYLDPDRVLHATDHTGAEALLGCGAVLDHFRVAMAAAGWVAHIERYPNPNNRMHLASVDFTPMDYVTDGHRALADAILRRRTDRLPFGPARDWESVSVALERAVTSDAVRLDEVPDELRSELAQASDIAETLRVYDSAYQSELDWWTGLFESSEGIPHSSLVSASESDRVEIGRHFPVTPNTERRPQVGRDQARILVLSTYDTDRTTVLECGEMLSAVLLEATVAGLATCTLTNITELWPGRDVVASLIGQTTTPQVIIRVGQAPGLEQLPPPTPRRPIDEVVEVRSQQQ
ncbi:NAD(P)H nitroreductase [Mycolicibacterium moriokaense]|nr:NAD(P)H nitroreductase [Mycolicibacterium moriokaense]MCV7040474.1 NAD(P)H nitroreductase [Mycolicibacterium moriokaense]ORB15106.1 NAD(P)H nitroreductase [Mycolicibacterium moriokaense]